MSTETVPGLRRRVKANPRRTTLVLSVVGYALVFGTFGGVIPFPEISRETVNLLSHAIAAVNTVALLSLVAGWRFVRREEIGRHRAAMTTAFLLILLFLALYLTKVGGGGEKEIVGATGLVYVAYIGMLAVHVVLSALSVPLVVHALVLGATHAPEELRETEHRRVGRAAASVWILSLALGVITYVMLNHVYGFRFMG
jgi:putative membrane protein